MTSRIMLVLGIASFCAHDAHAEVEKYGITAVAQLGVGHLDMHSTSDPPMSKTIPIANLTAGYSF